MFPPSRSDHPIKEWFQTSEQPLSDLIGILQRDFIN
jgi:hypothetical protein